MKNKELKEIYDALSEHNVIIKKQKLSTDYEFEPYTVSYQHRGRFVRVDIFERIQNCDYIVDSWNNKLPLPSDKIKDSDVYRIYIAAKLKSEGKAFVNPYQNAVVQKAQQKSK